MELDISLYTVGQFRRLRGGGDLLLVFQPTKKYKKCKMRPARFLKEKLNDEDRALIS